MLERRRSPRYNVRNVYVALLTTVDGRLKARQADKVTVETVRQVRLDRACTLLLHTEEGQTVRLRGHIASCRLGEVRTTPSGSSASVYENEILVAEDGSCPAESINNVRDVVTIEFSYEAVVRNMSPYGALIETELPLLVGSSSTLSLRFPEFAVNLPFCVVFSRELTDPSGARSYQLGIEFVAIDEARREALEKLIFAALA